MNSYTIFIAMARSKCINVLKNWVECPKTYQGPINLRFIWPIELTKTYHIVHRSNETYVLNLLGNEDHGYQYHILGTRLAIILVRKGHVVYDSLHDATMGNILVKDYQILAPELLTVSQLSITYDQVPNYLRMVRDREVIIYNQSDSGQTSFKIFNYGIELEKNTINQSLSYEELLRILIDRSQIKS